VDVHQLAKPFLGCFHEEGIDADTGIVNQKVEVA
jgi:hypothetical protein